MKIGLLSWHISYCFCKETPKQYRHCEGQSPPGKSEVHLAEQCRSFGEDWVMIWAWYGKSGISLAVPASSFWTVVIAVSHITDQASSNKDYDVVCKWFNWLPYDPIRWFHVVITVDPKRQMRWRTSRICVFLVQPAGLNVWLFCVSHVKCLWMKSQACVDKMSLI